MAAVGRALEMENDPDSVGEAHVGEADDVDGHWPGMPLEIDQEAPTTPPTIVFENSVGSGFGLGVTVDELASIAGALHAADVPDDRVGFCLDTAHAWGAGYELSDPAVTDTLLDELDRRIGLHRLRLIHVNDSRSEIGSRSDRHEHVGAGRIGEPGLAHVLRHPRLAHATYILETPGMDEGYDAINLSRALALARDVPLAPLPPGAFTLRSGRARAATPVDPPADSEASAAADTT